MIDGDERGAGTAELPPPDRPGIRGPKARTGFVLGIIGAAVYVAGATILPYASKADSSPGPRTLVGGYFHARPFVGVGSLLAALLDVLGVAVVVLAISIVGMRGDRHGRWAMALLGASSIWFLPVLEELIYVTRFSISFSWVGARTMDLGICLSFVGGVVALISVRAEQYERSGDETIASDIGRGEEIGVAVRPASGFLLALGGALLYVAASFLPFFRTPRSALTQLGLSGDTQALRSHSLAQGLLHGGALGLLGGISHVYGAAIIVGVLAVMGLVRRRKDLWAATLLGAGAAWSTGVPIQLVANRPIVKLAGFWGVQLAICVALLGGIVAVSQSLRYLTTLRRPTS